ncbi:MULTISPECIES: threonine--tRNA ligase [Nitrosomonas]|uniref:Threonine--tRNA ligase n=2 Tax=Nitrosomonas eutropha TaxID=916 RepID=SYT_NITEC|nr:threonine--tRNA ligase [Nitrosomonas eutropha]Q0ADN4.1 RecName: Full=Threonine--tRNA ligase; AltName: Full=Threonyl-tRNA synthetase; Short=ThrRS [Nitrosomonas eutropha C91]MXS80761.1 threonine--tRNA ligase [Nitrosomonas sp. GH22]ABI60548.1 threonyl-tRNA synthetase / Ser-tRNA(Thr) hydrolase [Nitrosomonas eutropha C91]PXV74856.1 Ser-tRNA(Thr) hydrolase /threonyl-tRNA synthetase [Nitrosomonas eutropha]SDX08795.1 Ser-tRNA(Thr) hydrolase /threonyl-tRNA synthetase [Nitrosomonas eutropha]SEJ29246
MTVVRLPDGTDKVFDYPVTVLDVAESIGPGLARVALAGKLNGRLVDLSEPIEIDSDLVLITNKDPEGLEIIRHSCAHLLAHAVKELFPSAQVTIGPVIEDGFYYDFSYERPFTPEDLAAIEKRMQEISRRNLKIERKVWDRSKAIGFFKDLGEHYKAQIIASIPNDEPVSLYSQGDFTDLCRGPHVPYTSRIKVFKLMKIAGAYWRGDSKNEMLQRIYGTAWVSSEEQNNYLRRLEEAEKRDHRKLGKQLDLFHMQEEAPGMVYWHPKGWAIWQQIEQYMRQVLAKNGYVEIRTPQVLDISLWEKSGHWENFRENMFITESESRHYAIKPMNCPGHVQVFNHGLRSYRDLPLRLAEFGSCHRNEASGALHGLMRVRSFTQDDAHIFCTEDQVLEEVTKFIDLLNQVYIDFGFHENLIKLSTRPAQRVGTEEQWDRAEAALAAALNQKELNWELQPGEGAFYGPKIEFTLKDSLGRKWQCGTLQLDFSMPARLGAGYIAEDNTKKIPVMLHRAILGSMERFIGILIEHHAGALPVWLSPDQVVVLNISRNQADYVQSITNELKQNDIRVSSDLRNEKISYKIREHSLQKVPYLIVVGDKEVENQTVTVRGRSNHDHGAMSLEGFVTLIRKEMAERV